MVPNATLKPGYCFHRIIDNPRFEWEIEVLPNFTLDNDRVQALTKDATWLRSESIDGAPCDVFRVKCPGSAPTYFAQTQVCTRNVEG